MKVNRMRIAFLFASSLLFHLAISTSALAFPGGTPPDMFGGPEEGEAAPNFELTTLDGRTVKLDEFLGKKPVVLELGSYTCPIFRGKHAAMETLYLKYRDQAEFLLLYTLEAHPSGDPSPYTGVEWVTEPNEAEGILYPQPRTTGERRGLAEKARQDLNVQMPVLVDDIQNNTWEAYGRAPNAAYLIGKDGRIKLRQGWLEPHKFEQSLTRELNSER